MGSISQQHGPYAWFKRNLKGDPSVWGVAFVLAIFSTLAVYSATSSLAYRQMQGNTEYYLFKHASLLLASFFCMWVAHNIDYRYYAGLSRLGLWISVPLLLFTWRHGATLNEASRWLMIPLINKTFQPSDLAQFALIAQLANMLAKRQAHIERFKESFVPMILWCSVICALIALTNLSGALLLFFTCMLLMYIGRVRIKHLLALVLVGIVAGGVAIGFGQRGRTAVSRIKSFTSGNMSFQAEQSYIAIATGGLYGKGPGKSDQRNVLPHPYSDFIYAILLEEYGLLGGIFILLLYLLLLYRGIQAAMETRSVFGGLLAAGLSFSLALQAMINMGVATGLMPVTGLTLPFVSMGGTSLLFTGVAIGIILSVSRGSTEGVHLPYGEVQAQKTAGV